MKRFVTLFELEIAVILRNGFHWIVLIALTVTAASFHLFPESAGWSPEVGFSDTSAEGIVRHGPGGGASETVFFGSDEELRKWVEEERRRIGFAVADGTVKPLVTLIHSGELPPRQISLLRAGIEAMVSGGTEGVFSIVEIGEHRVPLTLGRILLPVLIAFEVLILGFIFIAVTVFQEKQDGTLKAYRVSPSGTVIYTAAKAAAWVVITILYGAALILATVGPAVPWGRIIALLALAGLFMALAGLLVSVFFRNISEWFFIGVGILVVNMLPQVSFASPTFSPGWLRWIPSYPVLFAVRDLLYRPGAVESFERAMLQIGAYTAVLVPVTLAAVRGRLMKEGVK